MPEYRDDAYWDPFAECWVACTKPVVVDSMNPPLTDPNVLYGDRYGVDWTYADPSSSQEPTDEYVRGTCPAGHRKHGPCSLDKSHRGAHMSKQKVWSWTHEFFGTNESPASLSASSVNDGPR